MIRRVGEALVGSFGEWFGVASVGFVLSKSVSFFWFNEGEAVWNFCWRSINKTIPPKKKQVWPPSWLSLIISRSNTGMLHHLTNKPYSCFSSLAVQTIQCSFAQYSVATRRVRRFCSKGLSFHLYLYLYYNPAVVSDRITIIPNSIKGLRSLKLILNQRKSKGDPSPLKSLR